LSVATQQGNRIWPNWWRLAGVDGLIFVILFIIGGPILQGDFPMRGDGVETIRQYWVDEADNYLIGDYILNIAFVIFFLPYVIGLRWVLGSAEGSPPIWSWMSFGGAIIALAAGVAASMFAAGLALGFKDGDPGLDDATLLLLIDVNSYAFGILSMGLALFGASAGYVILRTGVLWRWLGVLPLIAAVLLVIGGAWQIDGDPEGALGSLGFTGLPLTFLFVLVSSIALILKSEEPAPVA
jgi:hypothetical protein